MACVPMLAAQCPASLRASFTLKLCALQAAASAQSGPLGAAAPAIMVMRRQHAAAQSVARLQQELDHAQAAELHYLVRLETVSIITMSCWP